MLLCRCQRKCSSRKRKYAAVLTHCGNRSNGLIFLFIFLLHAQNSLQRLTTACNELIFHKSKSSISHTRNGIAEMHEQNSTFSCPSVEHSHSTRCRSCRRNEKNSPFFVLALSFSHITDDTQTYAQLPRPSNTTPYFVCGDL